MCDSLAGGGATVSNEALQRDEVVAFVLSSEAKSCAVVEVASRKEVTLFADGKAWAVRATLGAPPDEALLHAARSLRLKHAQRELHMRFGRQRGKTILLHELAGRFRTLTDAAGASLALARSLAGVPPTARLWVTSSQYDDRGEPPRNFEQSSQKET
jgi:hypothetical protein